MAITEDEVRYVARLARIKLTDEQIKHFTGQLDRILEYVDKLKEVDVKDIPPTSHVLPLRNVYRPDKLMSSLSVEDALQSAPQRQGDFFEVPRIIE